MKKLLRKWLGIEEIEYQIDCNFNYTLDAFSILYNNLPKTTVENIQKEYVKVDTATGGNQMKRISFNQSDALRIVEWGMAYFQMVDHYDDACGVCDGIFKRLERFVDQDELKYLRRIVKKYPLTTHITSIK